MQKLWLKVLVGTIILILFLFAKSCYNRKTANLGDTEDKVFVQTITVTEQEMPLVYKTVASIQATKDLKLFSGIRGKIDKIYAPAGKKVIAGEKLLSILPNAEINAPITGIVGKWLVKIGEYVKDGDDLGRIVDNKELEAEYYVTENLIKYLELGQKVILEFRAFPDAKFIATVNYISPFIDEKRHSVLVRVNLENKEEKLLPGLFTNLTHILQVNPKALVIPESCIIKNLNGYEVYKVENNKIKKIAVTIGTTIKGRTEIKSGLNQNDLVVLTIPPGLADGKDVVVEQFTGTW